MGGAIVSAEMPALRDVGYGYDVLAKLEARFRPRWRCNADHAGSYFEAADALPLQELQRGG
jgi:hypothetical protein